ncbi:MULTISPECIES: DUF1002 domain-containing protein [Exiguobacterium]|uniref:DUF1002 domain-containing protein n=1 Tax=Exiguobacterium oxidotolerans TaxID=223958 RepID=A0A653I2J5_9BACL|nr:MULTISPECIES: DUF1002 domain-containing protein [Exiguobacterium]VWX33112.1 conserved exported hypothetical protein [Exiguobacterium oxidotolerans]
MNKATKIMTTTLLASSLLLPTAASAEQVVDKTIITLGESLGAKDKAWVLARLNAPEGITPVIATAADEEKYLGKNVPQSQLGGNMYSSAKIELAEKGDGLSVATENITWVTKDMYLNALVTAGVTDADITITSPYKVTGTSALTGIMKAYDQTSAETGIKLTDERKDLAQQELAVTSDVGKTVGTDKVAELMNEIKAEIAKQKPETKVDIENVIIQVIQNNNIQLSDAQMDRLTSLFSQMEKADLNWGQIETGLKSAGQDIQAFATSEETKGFFAKLFDGLSNFFKSISGLFK